MMRFMRFFNWCFTWCFTWLRPGRRGESQNDSESVANQANHSATSTVETEEHGHLAETNNQLNSVVESKSEEIEKLEREKKELETTNSSLRGVIVMIVTKDSEINQLNSVVETQSEKIEKLEREKKELETTNSSLRAVIVTKDAEIQNRKLAEQRKILNSIVNSVAMLKENQNKELQATISSKNTVIVTKDSEIQNLKADLNTTKSSLQEAIQTIAKFTEQFTEQGKLLNSIVKNNEKELGATISSLKAANVTKDAEIQNLKADLNTTKKSLDAVVQTNAKFTEQFPEQGKLLNSFAKNNEIFEATIRAKITEISKLCDSYTVSRKTKFLGLDWYFKVRRNNNNLEVYLRGRKPNADEWSCSGFYELQLISQKDANVVHRMGSGNEAVIFNEMNNVAWGFNNFISFEDLYNEEKGYVKDDSIILAAVIKAFPAQ